VKFVQDTENSSATSIVFHPDPSGTCSVVLDGTQAGCTYHETSTSCTLITDRSGLVVNVDASTDPVTYTYNATVGANVTLHTTLTCPGSPPVEFDTQTIENLMTAPAEVGFKVAADGKTLQDTYTVDSTPVKNVWTWDLTLDIPQPP